MFDRIKYFKQEEFDSPDIRGSGSNMDFEFVVRLDCLRGAIGRRFDINSGWRSIERNKAVGGAPGSAHRFGKAADIATHGWTSEERMELITLARKMGFNGVGIASGYIHLDIMPRVASWRYVEGGRVPIELGKEHLYA